VIVDSATLILYGIVKSIGFRTPMDDAFAKMPDESWEQCVDRLLDEMKSKHPNWESYSTLEKIHLSNQVYHSVTKYRMRKGDFGISNMSSYGPRGGRYTIEFSGKSGRPYRRYF
jgi:hypothetical protein